MADTPAQVALDEKGLTYGQKLIAEAIEHHFGDRIEDYDEDVDDGVTQDAWDAFDTLTRAYLSSLSREAGDDGQGALVERLRKAADEMREEGQNGWPVTCDDAADRIEALTRKNAALRAGNERLERERDRYRNGLQVLATTFYKGDEHQDYAKHVLGNDAAERHLAEQGQAQGEATRGAAIFGEGAQARVYDVFRADPETRGDHADYYKRGVANIMRPAKDTTAYAAWLAGRHATPPSPDPDAELIEALGLAWTMLPKADPELADYPLYQKIERVLHRHRKQGGA